MPRPTKELGTCDSCGSEDLVLDGKETTTCKLCGQHLTSVWLCRACGEEMRIMTMTPRTSFMKDGDIETGREHYGFKKEELQQVGN